jgi:hypothetical protein
MNNKKRNRKMKTMKDSTIIYDRDILETKQQIIGYAMLYFGIERYKLDEGAMEYELYNLSCEIGDLWEKEGWIEEIIISGDMCSETISDEVSEYIKNNK